MLMYPIDEACGADSSGSFLKRLGTSSLHTACWCPDVWMLNTGDMWRLDCRAANMQVKTLRTLGLMRTYRLQLLCDAKSAVCDCECSEAHPGYTVKLAGSVLKQLAPALRVASSVMRLASIAGKVVRMPFVPPHVPGVKMVEVSVRVS